MRQEQFVRFSYSFVVKKTFCEGTLQAIILGTMPFCQVPFSLATVAVVPDWAYLVIGHFVK